MLLSHKTSVKVTEDQANIIGHMCYAAYKLWNVCNYERLHYKEMDLDEYPDWYYQKKHIRTTYGISNCRHRPHRKYANFLIRHGNLFISCRKHMVLKIRNLQDLNRRISQSLTCRKVLFMQKETAPYGLHCQNS